MPSPVKPPPPLRELPEHSVPMPPNAQHHHIPLSGGSSPHGLAPETEQPEEKAGKPKESVMAAMSEMVATDPTTEIAPPPVPVGAPVFRKLDFGGDASSDSPKTPGTFTAAAEKEENLISPTER